MDNKGAVAAIKLIFGCAGDGTRSSPPALPGYRCPRPSRELTPPGLPQKQILTPFLRSFLCILYLENKSSDSNFLEKPAVSKCDRRKREAGPEVSRSHWKSPRSGSRSAERCGDCAACWSAQIALAGCLTKLAGQVFL